MTDMQDPGAGGPSVDVAVVGAGPTGLLLAILLARLGVGLRIVDRSTAAAQESRAFALQARSLEILSSIGLADAILDKGLLAAGARVYVEGHEAAEFTFDDIGRTDTPYSFVLAIPQSELELILSAELKRLGIAVERGVTIEGLDQDETGVSVTGQGPDGVVAMRAGYVVGADGAHSIVRKSLGLSFEGGPYPQSFLLADCRIEGALDLSRLAIFLGRENFALHFPLRGRGYGRIIASQPSDPGAPTSQGFAPASLGEVEAALRAASGQDLRLHDGVWVSRYRIHHRAVDRYRRGRGFVAGDAAHIHSPAGGQGMNTGLQDAANLAWKLAAVIKGGAPDALLDTYHSERWPIGQKLLEVTDRLFERMTSQSPLAARIRNLVVPVVAGAMSRFEAARARAFHFISELGIRYHASSHVRDGSTRAWTDAPRAGGRAPDAAIARGLSVFDLVEGFRFHVLALSRQPLNEAEVARLNGELAGLPRAIGADVRTHLVANSLIGRDPRLVRVEGGSVFGAYGVDDDTPQALFLIRPDGYVAWRCDRLDIAALRSFLIEAFATA